MKAQRWSWCGAGMLGVAFGAACGSPAERLAGEYQVPVAHYTIRDEFDGSFNQPGRVEENTFDAEDCGTMTFSAEPTAPGAFSFSRSLSKVFDRLGIQETDHVVEVEPTPITVGYDINGDRTGIFIYDSSSEWNGEFLVQDVFGVLRLVHTLHTDHSPTERTFETFVFELAQ